MLIDFDTPKSSSIRIVNVSGTVPVWAKGVLSVYLHVTGTSPTRDDKFVREVDLSNASSVPFHYTGTYNMAIVPKLHGLDTVTASWGFSQTATIVITG